MRSIAVLGLAALAARGLGQESNLLAACLGKPLSAYGDAFGEHFVETVKTPHGPAKSSEFKTGSAAITVFQPLGAPIATEIVADFYQVPTLTWSEALVKLGLSGAGVKAKAEGGRFRLSGLKAPPNRVLDALFDPKSAENLGNPSLRITIRRGRATSSK